MLVPTSDTVTQRGSGELKSLVHFSYVGGMSVQGFSCMCRCEFTHVCEAWNLMAVPLLITPFCLLRQVTSIIPELVDFIDLAVQLALGIPISSSLSTGFIGGLLTHQTFMWCWVSVLWPSCLSSKCFTYWSSF